MKIRTDRLWFYELRNLSWLMVVINRPTNRHTFSAFPITQGYWQGHAKWGGSRGCVRGVTPPLFWNLSVFWQNVLVKFPDPMLSVNFDYFIIKKRNAEFYQYPVNNTNVNSLAKTTLSSLWNKISKKLTCNKKFLNRVAEKTKIVQGKTFIPTNNYDLFYLK